MLNGLAFTVEYQNFVITIKFNNIRFFYENWIGNMWEPICGHLINAGHAVTAYDVSSDALTRIISKAQRLLSLRRLQGRQLFSIIAHPNISVK